MPRIIKGYKFQERQRDWFEACKSYKFYIGCYGIEQIRVLNMINQFGKEYWDFYLKIDAKKIREINSMFGSYMNFKDIKTGNIIGDRIHITKG